jgi:hypothetical protein
MSAHLSRPRLFQRHLRSLVWVCVWVWDWIHSHTPPRTRSPSSRHPPFTHYPFPLPPRSLVCGGQPSPHKPRLVVPHSTCPPLSSSPHAHSFVLGTAVINTRTHTHSTTIEDPGRFSQGASLKPDESEGCSPVSGGRTIRLCRRTTVLPRFDPRYTLVPGIYAEPSPSLQWCLGLLAVERMWALWSSSRGESNLRTHGPKFCTFPLEMATPWLTCARAQGMRTCC